MTDSHQHLVDVSHTIHDGLVTYQGLPAPVIGEHLSREDSRRLYAPGVEFHIGSIEMVANTGTYLDSPFHRYADGTDLSNLPLSSLADLPGLLVPIEPERRAVEKEDFLGLEIRGKAVLIYTAWDRHWTTPQYFEDHPYLTQEAAEYLRDAEAALVGIDSYNIDNTSDLSRPAHSTLLGAGIPIVEHLCNLQQLPEHGFRFFAVPAKVQGMGSFPVRAFAIVTGP